jgi:hypothetical protein
VNGSGVIAGGEMSTPRDRLKSANAIVGDLINSLNVHPAAFIRGFNRNLPLMIPSSFFHIVNHFGNPNQNNVHG